MQWYLTVLRRYADFTGRSRRTEYWMFTLLNVVVVILLTVLDVLLGLVIGGTSSAGYGVLSTIYSLAVLVPSLAVGARRLHDTDRSGWWQLLGVVPGILTTVLVPFGSGSTALSLVAGVVGLATLVAAVVLIVFMVTDGRPGPNRYGPNPKEIAHV